MPAFHSFCHRLATADDASHIVTRSQLASSELVLIDSYPTLKLGCGN
jgi:hypothetical protein